MVLVLALIEASYRVARKAGKWLLNSFNDSLQISFDKSSINSHYWVDFCCIKNRFYTFTAYK